MLLILLFLSALTRIYGLAPFVGFDCLFAFFVSSGCLPLIVTLIRAMVKTNRLLCSLPKLEIHAISFGNFLRQDSYILPNASISYIAAQNTNIFNSVFQQMLLFLKLFSIFLKQSKDLGLNPDLKYYINLILANLALVDYHLLKIC